MLVWQLTYCACQLMHLKEGLACVTCGSFEMMWVQIREDSDQRVSPSDIQAHIYQTVQVCLSLLLARLIPRSAPPAAFPPAASPPRPVPAPISIPMTPQLPSCWPCPALALKRLRLCRL